MPCILVENDERLFRDGLQEVHEGYSRTMPNSFTSPAARNISNPLGMRWLTTIPFSSRRPPKRTHGLGQDVPCYAVNADRKKCRDHFNICDKYRFLHPSRRFELSVYQWRQCGFHMFCYMQVSRVAPRRLPRKVARQARSKSLWEVITSCSLFLCCFYCLFINAIVKVGKLASVVLHLLIGSFIGNRFVEIVLHFKKLKENDFMRDIHN